MSAPKDEALRAIEHVEKMLAAEMDPLNRRIALATLDYAKGQVHLIVEAKRQRREPPPAQATLPLAPDDPMRAAVKEAATEAPPAEAEEARGEDAP